PGRRIVHSTAPRQGRRAAAVLPADATRPRRARSRDGAARRARASRAAAWHPSHRPRDRGIPNEMTVNRALVAVATRLVWVLVAAWPARLRSAYGPEMKKTFADGCADAAARGTPALGIHIIRELADLTIATVRARRVRNPRAASSTERLT